MFSTILLYGTRYYKEHIFTVPLTSESRCACTLIHFKIKVLCRNDEFRIFELSFFELSLMYFKNGLNSPLLSTQRNVSHINQFDYIASPLFPQAGNASCLC